MNELTPTRLKLPGSAREEIVTALNQHLADLLDLHFQAKHAHWNVRGPLFYSLHKTFDEVASLVHEHLDELAERVATLGGIAAGTVRQSAKRSRLAEANPSNDGELPHAQALVEQVSVSAAWVRNDIEKIGALGDPGTTDLLTDISKALDKSLWLLEAHLFTPQPHTAEANPRKSNGQLLPKRMRSLAAIPFLP
jgi:starvation-inducible DNA-binding protein